MIRLVDGTVGKKAVELYSEENRFFALMDSGRVICWGSNTAQGRCGAGSTATYQQVPIEVDSTLLDGTVGKKAVSLHAADSFTCVVTDDGKVLCWGLNTHGMLGNGTTITSNIPVEASSAYLDGTTGKKSRGILLPVDSMFVQF